MEYVMLIYHGATPPLPNSNAWTRGSTRQRPSGDRHKNSGVFVGAESRRLCADSLGSARGAVGARH
jgi:hypothetical protein